jgi:predicted transcriptional regulator
MFITIKEHKHTTGLKKPGDTLPEILKGDVEAALALVRSGYVKWEGEGGEFGPFTDAALALEAAQDEMLRARLAKIKKADAPAPKPAEHTEAALAAEKARSAGLEAANKKLESSLASVLARVAALESKSEGSAPASGSAPSGSKGGR